MPPQTDFLTEEQRKGIEAAKKTRDKLQGLSDRGFGSFDVSQLGSNQDISEIPNFRNEPTLGDVFTLGDTDVSDEIFSSKTQPVDPFSERDEEDIRRATEERFRRQIESTNAVYDNLLAEARMESKDRLGQERAISARSGLLGSDFGRARKDKVQGFNRDIEGGIQAERQQALNAIMFDIENTASEEIAEKRAAREAGAEAYLEHLRTTATRKDERFNNIVASIVAQGVDINDLTDEQFEQIARNLGKNKNAVIAAVNQAKALQVGESEESFTLKEGERRFDSQGNLIAEGKGEKFTLDEGETIVDENGNVIAEGKDKQRVLKEGDVVLDADGNVIRKIPKTATPRAEGSDEVKSGGLTISTEVIGQGSQQLNESRGETGFASTQLYQELMSDWQVAGGLVKDFLKEYPPEQYVNPEDKALQSWLSAQLEQDELSTLLGF